MKVKDLAAELIGEIADEFGYVVYKYECVSPSTGSICFEIDTDGDGDNPTSKFKMMDYSGYEVNLITPGGPNSGLSRMTIDLHKPDSVEKIREWFGDVGSGFNNPFWMGSTFSSYSSGFGISGSGNQTKGYNQISLGGSNNGSPSYTLTTSISKNAPTIYATATPKIGYGHHHHSVSNPSFTINKNNNIFNFNGGNNFHMKLDNVP